MGMGPGVAIVPPKFSLPPPQKSLVTMQECDFLRSIIPKKNEGYKITKDLLKHIWSFLNDKSLLELRLAFWCPEGQRCAQSTKILKTALEILTTRIGKRLYPDISKVVGCVATKELVDALRKYRKSGWNGTERREKVKDNPEITTPLARLILKQFIGCATNEQKRIKFAEKFAEDGRVDDATKELDRYLSTYNNGGSNDKERRENVNDNPEMTAYLSQFVLRQFIDWDTKSQKLREFAREGKLEGVKTELGKEGVGINGVGDEGMAALLWAADRGHANVVEFLVKQEGIDVNTVDDSGITALHRAASNGHASVVEGLLKHEHIKIHALDKDLQTPLHLAAARGREGATKILLDNGANVNAVDKHRMTALHWATARGHANVVEILVKQKNIDLNVVDENGDTPLDWAEKEGHKEVERVLRRQKGIVVKKGWWKWLA